VPSFEAFGRALEAANPFVLWAQAAQLAWLPWLETLALARELTPSPPPPSAATASRFTQGAGTSGYNVRRDA
jgi:hypothetical protein